MIAERDEELDCVVDPHALQIKSGDGQEFKGHVLARLESRKKSQPFEVRMRIIAEQNVTQDRIYTFRFLPQEPMRLVLRLPSASRRCSTAFPLGRAQLQRRRAHDGE